MRSRHQDQRSLPPMEVRRSEQDPSLLRNQEHSSESFLESEQPDGVLSSKEQWIADSSLFYDRCLRKAGIERKAIADLFGFTSVSVVDKWCNPNDRSCPSSWQLFAHPVSYHIAVRELQMEQVEFRRALAQRLLDVALALGA